MFFGDVCRFLPSTDGGSRLYACLTLPRRQSFTTTLCLPRLLGAYMLCLAKGDIGQNELRAVTQVLLLCGELLEKVIST